MNFRQEPSDIGEPMCRTCGRVYTTSHYEYHCGFECFNANLEEASQINVEEMKNNVCVLEAKSDGEENWIPLGTGTLYTHWLLTCLHILDITRHPINTIRFRFLNGTIDPQDRRSVNLALDPNYFADQVQSLYLPDVVLIELQELNDTTSRIKLLGKDGSIGLGNRVGGNFVKLPSDY